LHLAAENGHISIVKELIEVRNAEINGRNGNGEAALWIARRSGKADIVAYLISRGGIE
jgi:ankyrin repeat protein